MIEYLNSGTITTQIGFYKEIYKVMGLAQKLFGTHSEHELKRIYPIADKIESYRESYGRLSDEELKGKTKEFKDRLAKGETLDDILPEAFATVREAGRRVLGMEHYRVQLIGGIILHQGRIAEMKTGEGKTLVCTLPAYLNALTEEGVIVVTVNDYLAKRDAEQMGMIHEFLGLKVGVVLHDSTREERQAAYGSDITYVTNNELGFDYLRDNMAIYKSELVLRNLKYCIIDEVDSVLIDEARTPLIISGQSGKSTKLYELCDILARQLQRGEYKGERTKMQAIMNEVVENYDIEGVHIDDYFYPYGKIPYEREEQDYLKNRKSENENFEDWRRRNVDEMIENIHNELKKSFSKTGKKVLFGISPFAIYRTNDKIRKDGWEKGSYNSEGALQCYSELYSDVYKWMKENWIDYVVPQVYFPFERVDVTYHDLTKWWNDIAKYTHTTLYIGQGLYQMGSNEFWQNPEEIANQLKFNCQFDHISGTIFFTYRDLVKGQNDVKDKALDTIKELWCK